MDLSQPLGVSDPSPSTGMVRHLERRRSIQRKLPDKLYDREAELGLLLDRYKAVCSSDNSTEQKEHFVLITGASGVGKTALAKSLQSHVQRDSGYFIAGKFERTKQSSGGFSVFHQVLSDYADQVVERHGTPQEALKEKVLQATSGVPHLLTDSVPSLRAIMGVQQTAQDTPILGNNERLVAAFHRAYSNFLATICSPNCPVVLLLDDLQWAGSEALGLLENVLTNAAITSLMIIGTCRGNEVSLEDDLSVLLRRLEDINSLKIVEIPIYNLSKEAVQQMVKESIDTDPDTCGTFAHMLYARTGGNVFFAIHFLESIARDGIPDNDAGGEFKLDSRSKIVDPVSLLRSEIRRQPDPLPELLKVAACLGATIIDPTLVQACVEGLSEDDFICAESAGLLVRRNDGHYAFAHDKIHEASYSMTPEQTQKQFQLLVARKLLRGVSTKSLQSRSAAVAGLLCQCVDSITDNDERQLCASIFYDAGRKEAKSSSFHRASLYFELGRGLLPCDPWFACYNLTLQLFSSSAEMEYVNGDVDHANALIEEVLANAVSLSDKLPVYVTRIYLLSSLSEFKECLEVAFDTLRQLGQHFPQKVSFFHIAVESVKTRRMLSQVHMDDIVELPLVQDRECLAAMTILNMIFATCFYYPPYNKHGILVSYRMVQMTIKEGICEVSSVAFAIYSIYLASSLDRLEEAENIGKVALTLLNRFQTKAWASRVYLLVHGNLSSIFRTPQSCIELIMFGHSAGLMSGDIQVSLFFDKDGFLKKEVFNACTAFSWG